MLLALGTKRFGKPPVRIRKAVAAITAPVVLERLAVRLLDVDTWNELLADLD